MAQVDGVVFRHKGRIAQRIGRLPQGHAALMKNQEFMHLLAQGIVRLDEQFPSPAADAQASGTADPGAAAILARVAERLTDNYPYFHPLYAGQMLKPPHPIARAAYAMAMAINPNNHALDGGRASSQMEIEAVAAFAKMFGLPQHLGHLTSGGTFANLEALWVAGQLVPGAAILASDQAHYTHSRISSVLKLNFETVPTDRYGRMDMAALESRLQQAEVGERRKVGTVVATLGTTAVGSVDPLADILGLARRYNFRVHVDAAYGGYFCLSSGLDKEAASSFEMIASTDSIVIDPHKHGLQPYGCGCILFRDPSVGRLYKHDSPYTYFSSAELHLGEISLECSRAGAAAVALWATQQLLPLVREGCFAVDLDSSRTAALDLYARLAADPHFVTAFPPELDIVLWAVRAETVEASSRLAQRVFDEAAARNLHLALALLPTRLFPPDIWPDADNTTHIRCLRSVLMKPEHAVWMPEIYRLLTEAAEAVTR